MRETGDAFHLAIPAGDLDEAFDFYVTGLGCKLARRYADRITLDFFGDQVVCHLSDQVIAEPELYPRHFGVTFREQADWDRLVQLGLVEEHHSFVLQDPSGNLLEFKHYADPRMMY